MGNEQLQAGWHADPTGRYPHRYYDGTSWTDHVARDGEQVSDPLPGPPTATASAVPAAAVSGATAPAGAMQVAAGGRVAVVELPDTPEGASKRRTFGFLMLGTCGVVLLSLFLPWLRGAPEFSQGAPQSLAGFESSVGIFTGMLAVLIGLYGAQGAARPRVRYHVGALIALIFMAIAPLAAPLTVEDSDLEKLEVASTAETEEVLGGIVQVQIGGSGLSEAEKAKRVDPGPGLYIGAIAALATIWPLAVLWHDDRDRRRRAGLLV